MTHILCPICGKYSAFSSLRSHDLELDFKAVDFKGLGRGRGFLKGDLYSILGYDEYTPILAERIENLYNMLVSNGILVRTVDDYTMRLERENNDLRSQSENKDTKNLFLREEIKKKDIEIEEIQLRCHVYYIILESLTLDPSAKLEYNKNSNIIVKTPHSAKLFLFIFLLREKIPLKLLNQLLTHIEFEKYTFLKTILKNVPEKRTVADELMGDSNWRYRGLDYTGVDPYTLKLSELEIIVERIKNKLTNPVKLEELMKKKSENF